MRFGSLFSGIGGIDLGLERSGMECAWQVENEPYCLKVLAKHWPNVKRYEDIREVDFGGVERVDLVCGGFPCQDLSYAGKGAGLSGERSGLWTHFKRAICDLRPRYVLIENVPGLLSARGRIPARCLCGWPDRRGRMSNDFQEPREVVFGASGNRHDGESFTSAPLDADELWRQGYEVSGRYREMGSSLALEDSWQSSDRVHSPDSSSLEAKNRTRRSDSTAWQSDEFVSSGGNTEEGNQQAQPEGSEACPNCNRPMAKVPEGYMGAMGVVLGDLASLGYDAEWESIPAAAFGAPHLRWRVFIVAYTQCSRRMGAERDLREHDASGRYEWSAPQDNWLSGETSSESRVLADAEGAGCQARSGYGVGAAQRQLRRVTAYSSSTADVAAADNGNGYGWSGNVQVGRSGCAFKAPPGCNAGRDQWGTEPNVGRVAPRISSRVDRLRGLGNAVVPQKAEYLGRLILEHAGVAA